MFSMYIWPKFADRLHSLSWLISSPKHIDTDDDDDDTKELLPQQQTEYQLDGHRTSNLAIVQICECVNARVCVCAFISKAKSLDDLFPFGFRLHTFATEWISHCSMALPCLHFI